MIKKKGEKKVHEKTAKELSDETHLKAVGFKTFENSKEHSKPWEMSSFVETKSAKLAAKNPIGYVDYNSRQLSRIYPKGVRVDSSNYDPVPNWNHGCQIVALNYQTGTEPMWLNDGKFQDNGKCGFILKPKVFREDKITFDPEAKANVVKTLKFIIISGWHFPKHQGKEHKTKGEVIDPYVKIKVHGVSNDCKSAKTKVIKNNGLNPIWKADFKFSVTQPDLALLLFSVSDSDLVTADNVIGHYSLSLNNVREGYRCVPLRSSIGDFYDSASLLVYIESVK